MLELDCEQTPQPEQWEIVALLTYIQKSYMKSWYAKHSSL